MTAPSFEAGFILRDSYGDSVGLTLVEARVVLAAWDAGPASNRVVIRPTVRGEGAVISVRWSSTHLDGSGRLMCLDTDRDDEETAPSVAVEAAIIETMRATLAAQPMARHTGPTPWDEQGRAES